MKPVRIYFQKNFPTAQFQNEHYGVEIELEQGDSVEQAFKEARNICFNQFSNDNPQIQWHEDMKGVFNSNANDKPILTPSYLKYDPQHITIEETPINKGTIEEQIVACTTDKELKSFEMIARMNPKLIELWSKKAKELKFQI
jgi:hypothetical protein